MKEMKVFKSIYNKLLVATMILAIVACDPSDFGNLNDDPNNTTTAQMSGLLTNSLRQLKDLSAGNNARNFRAGNLYVQYVGNTQYTGDDNYDQVNFSYNGMYIGAMADLNLIVQANTNPETAVEAAGFGSNGNQIAVALTLGAYYYLHITNRWGDIPFSEALQAADEEQIFQPKFDTQQDVYNGIFAMLDQARAAMDSGPSPQGDILFGGDMTQWRQFGATIRLVAALNLSKANSSQGSSQLNQALSDGILPNGVYYQFLAETANQNPWYAAFITRADWSMAEPLVNWMNPTTEINPFTGVPGMMDVIMDPRLPKYANGSESTNFTKYIGQPYGLTEADAGAISNAEVSMLGDHMRQQDMLYPIFSEAQILFIRAEAAQMGWTSENAQAMYEDAILASLTEYGVESDYATFMTNSLVAWTPGQEMQRIHTQKWVATFLVGYEAWANWRRTITASTPDGIPALQPSPNGVFSNTIPSRQGYPTSARDLNSANWQAALDSQFDGVDDLNGILWVYK